MRIIGTQELYVPGCFISSNAAIFVSFENFGSHLRGREAELDLVFTFGVSWFSIVSHKINPKFHGQHPPTDFLSFESWQQLWGVM